METDAAEPSNSEEKGEIVSYTINPGTFKMKMVQFPENLGSYNFSDLPPLPSPHYRFTPGSSDEYKSRLEHRRKRRNRFSRREASLIDKYHSLANERKLRFASSTSNVELLCEMLDQGTNPNCYDEHKRSPLHLAACRGYGDIITMLLQKGANPNILDSLGNTPLHLSVISASSKKFNNVVRLLLNHGASVHITDRTGKNPLELAQKKLKLMKYRNENPTPEMREILQDLCVLVALILKHFLKEKEDIDNLNALEAKLSNLSTEDVPINPMDDADALLASVEKLKL